MIATVRTTLRNDSRGASSMEYLGIVGTVAALGIAAFIGLGGGMDSAIGGAGKGGGMVTSSQAGAGGTADHPQGVAGAGGGGGDVNGGSGNADSSPAANGGEGTFFSRLLAGMRSAVVAPAQVGATHATTPPGDLKGAGAEIGRGTRSLFDVVRDLASLPGKNVVADVDAEKDDPGTCWNPLNFFACIGSLDDDDFRVFTINAANAHTCKSGKDGAEGELETDCEGNPDHYRTKENRRRLAKLIQESDSHFVAMQEIMAGNPGFGDGLDTGLRTAARVNDAFSVFLEGTPNEDYLVTDLGTPCRSLPCKQISPDGTVLYRTEEGTYISSATLCSGGKDETCPDGSVRNREGNIRDPYFGSWDSAANPVRKVYEDGKVRRVSKVQRPDDEDRRYGNSVLVTHGDEEVTDAYTVILPHEPGAFEPPLGRKKRGALNDYNNRARLAYGEVDKEQADNQPRAAMVTVVKSPDGTERVVINVHLARRGKDGTVQRSQLEALAKLVDHASEGGREVVVTGDFNMKPPVVADVFDDAGLTRAAGEGIDQVWVLAGIDTKGGRDVASKGASDHDVGAETTLE